MNMLIWAIQTAGLNRARIRDMFAYRTTPWDGVTGEIQLSAVLDDVGGVFLAKRENGDWHYYSRSDLGIPVGAGPWDESTRTGRSAIERGDVQQRPIRKLDPRSACPCGLRMQQKQ